MNSNAETAPRPRPLGRAAEAAPRHDGAELWASFVHIALVLVLIPAVWLGTLTIPRLAAIALVVVIAGYVALLVIGPRWIAALRRPDLVLVLDLLVITSLLLVSGDLSSPFLFLYYLVILEAALRLNMRQAFEASVATAGLIILGWLRAGHAEALKDAGFRLGAFIAGGFLLAFFLGILMQEHRARREQIQWAGLLDQRLREATKQLEAQLEELQFYNDLASQLSGELRTNGVMEILFRAFLKATGFSGGVAYVIGEGGTPQLAALHGIARTGDDPELATPKLTLPDAAVAGEPIVLPQPPESGLPGTLAVSVPVVRGGRLQAWLCGLTGEPSVMLDSTRRLLHGIAAQGASALDAAFLHEEVQRMSRKDPMRSLFSWSDLEGLVTSEIERCRTLTLVFSLAEIQLEDHGASRAEEADRDLALRRVVNLIQASLRRVDVLSYDGAGRFAILLPRMPKVRATDLLQMLVQKLENDTVASRLLMVDRVVLTAGVVTFPEDGTTASPLFASVEGLLVLGPSSPARVQVPVS